MNTTKYKQYAINIKQQLQINIILSLTEKLLKSTDYIVIVSQSYNVGLDLPGTRIDQSIDLVCYDDACRTYSPQQ